MDAATLEIIKLIPSLCWFLLVAGLIVSHRRWIRDELLPNLSGLKVLGVEVSFIKASFDAAVEIGEKSPQWKIEVPEKAKQAALRRVKQRLDVFRGARILWVDDHPENNRNERRMFRQLRAEMDLATTSEEALKKLQLDIYDVVISDIGRDNPTDKSGLAFLHALRSGDQSRKPEANTPVVFYVGNFNAKLGTPAGAFGITNRPDELLHFVLDVLERRP